MEYDDLKENFDTNVDKLLIATKNTREAINKILESGEFNIAYRLKVKELFVKILNLEFELRTK